jgi:CheY-like chemotaxis protein
MPLAPPTSAGRFTRVSVRSLQRAKGTLLLVDRDALRRATVARLLLPARWDLQTASSHDEVLDAARDGANPTAVVVAVEHPSVESVVRTAVANWPGAAVVVHGELGGAPAGLLDFLVELRQVRVCTRDESLLDRVDALVAEVGRS